ncbi:uncharacterized protein LOC128896631 [Hylaeus anthracinus]|uniref:uncharacterized protein LOC128896631 n=1 Tax=Hylaeus anthracinus TaxID=313031 RepID=UPI0023B949F2|nr:uncharacterized protein LOC128896631 [Hylaeus anthracinus]
MEKRAAVVIANEQYRDRDCSTWFRDDLGTAAVWITDPRRVRIDSHGAAAGHVWITSGVLTYVSCYLSPNDSISEFREKLDVLKDTLRDKSGGLVVAGDFNARACEWGMPRPDTRGRLVVDMASRLGLVVLNVGSTPTYRRPGFGDSIPDVTLVSEDLVQRAAYWRVIGDFTGSDHSYITFQLIGERQARPPGIRRPRGYVTSRLDEDRLYATLQAGVEALPQTSRDPSDRAGAEAIIRGTLNLIRRACDESMPRRRPFSGRRQVYWWTDQIASLRREALRRRAQRARSRPEAAALSEDYKAVKKRDLCDDLNRDPFGEGYKLVTRSLGGLSASPELDATTIRSIVDALFPAHPMRRHDLDPVAGADVPMFTAAEPAVAARAMKLRKAPGPDGIPWLRRGVLYTGIFPAQWKSHGSR